MANVFFRKTGDEQVGRDSNYYMIVLFTPSGAITYGVESYEINTEAPATVHGYVADNEVVAFPANMPWYLESRDVWTSEDEFSYREKMLERAQTEKMFQDQASRVLKKGDKEYE